MVAHRRSGRNASSSSLKNKSCVSIPYTLSRKRTTDCLCAGINPEGVSDFGRSSPAAGFCRVKRKLNTPCKSSKGTSDRRIARARKDSFFPYKQNPLKEKGTKSGTDVLNAYQRNH